MTFSDTEIRVSSDLENPEMSGNFEARRKSGNSQGINKKEDKKSQGKSSGILLCEIHFRLI